MFLAFFVIEYSIVEGGLVCIVDDFLYLLVFSPYSFYEGFLVVFQPYLVERHGVVRCVIFFKEWIFSCLFFAFFCHVLSHNVSLVYFIMQN